MTLKTLIRKIKNLHRRDVRTDQYIINRLVDQRDILLSYIYALDDDEFDVLGSSERKVRDNIKYIYEKTGTSLHPVILEMSLISNDKTEE